MGRDEVGGRRKKANARGQEVGVLTWSIRGPSHSGCQQAMPIEDAMAQFTAPVAVGKVNCSSRTGMNNSRIEESS